MNIELRELAEEIVSVLCPRYPWEEIHEADVEYVLSVLEKVLEEGLS